VKARRALTSLWYGSGHARWHPRSIVRGLIGTGLSPLSLAFRSAVSMRRKRPVKARTGDRLPVPVVVVGNLTVGGSGKTPLVIALVEALKQKGYQPGVISRGYGGSDARARKTAVAVDATLDDAAARFGDEPVLIRRRTNVPVHVGRRRVEAARTLLAEHPEVDVLLSDDGLQHYALARNFEIAVFDARGAGNRRMLPAGPLREPLSRLADVDAVVLNGKDAVMPKLPKGVVTLHPPYRMELIPGEIYRVNDPSVTRPLDGFRGRRLTAAAGIGNPQRFFALLRAAGLSSIACRSTIIIAIATTRLPVAIPKPC